MDSHYQGPWNYVRPLKHDPEISPRDFKESRTDHIPIMYKQPSDIYYAYKP